MNIAFTSNHFIHAIMGVFLIFINALAQPKPSGFASVNGKGLETTTGGYGGDTVTVDNQKDLEKYAGSDKPYVIMLKGTIKISPKGHETVVKSNKTIHGIGATADMDGGGFRAMGESNIIFRNFSCHDNGGGESDPDCIQMDNCHHIWIDHCHFYKGADGLIDSRKNTTFLTVSWTILSDHNKTFGIGWTPDVTSQITVHHCWLRNTNQRNPSADNVKKCHLYNNFMQNITSYGNFSRGSTNMVIENSVYEKVRDPHYYATGTLWVKGNIYRDISGKKTAGGDKYFEPKDFYAYALDRAEDVEKRLAECAGPREDLSCADPKSATVFPAMVQGYSGQNPVGMAIYSLQGKFLYQLNFGSESKIEWSVPFGGPYILRLLTGNGSIQTKKVFFKTKTAIQGVNRF